jgi:tetratricopeptide (TPR) repeat protein
MPEVVRTSRTLLGIVAHKADRLDEPRAHLDAALTLALDAGDRTDEAYCRQELGFRLLDTGDPELALGEFHAVLALAPGVGIVDLAGNGLNGMGAALLQLGRAAEAVPFLLAPLAIRAELEDLDQQYVDLAHLSRPRRWRSATQASPRGSSGSSMATPTLQPGCMGTTDARCGPCSRRPPV